MAASRAICCVAFVALNLLLYLYFFILLTSGTVELPNTTSYALADCAPLPPPSSAANISSFRERLLPLLAALPAAAALPGFASLQSDDHSAFVRGQCLSDTASHECHACLTVAAENLTDLTGCASRRAGVWRSEGCFLAYADANTSSAREDAFRHVIFSGEDPGEGPNCFDPRRLVALAQSMARRGATNASVAQVATDAADLLPNVATAKNTVRVLPNVVRGQNTVRMLAQCAWDRSAGCARCLGDSALQVPPCSWGLDGVHVRAADVVGYSCFLRMKTSVPERPVKWLPKPLAIALCVLTLLVAVAATLAAAIAAVLGH